MAAAAPPRGRVVAVTPCAGAYVSGAVGSNACPAGSVRIEAEAACRTAAAAAGMIVGNAFVETTSARPRGCYYWTDNNYAYLNNDAAGAGFSRRQLLCAIINGAPFAPFAPMRARAPARVCAARRCVRKEYEWPN